MRYDLLMKNCRIPEGDNAVPADIAVKDGVIAAIFGANSEAEADNVLDIGGKLVLPGCIDSHTHYIATDHAPYEIATEKAAEGMDIWTSFPGIPGTETMVSVLVSEGYNKGRLSLHRLAEVLSTAPAIHYGLYPKKGALLPGSDADFTVLDLDKEWTVDESKTQCKAKYTPFHGMRLKGGIDRTIVRGKVVFEQGSIVGEMGCGQFVRRQSIQTLDRTMKF